MQSRQEERERFHLTKTGRKTPLGVWKITHYFSPFFFFLFLNLFLLDPDN